MKKNNKKTVVCLPFFCTLCGFWAADCFTEDRLYSEWEKRILAQKPTAEWSSVMNGSYGNAYEEWLLDQFPGRDRWVHAKTQCEILLGKKEIDGIYLGKDGYLFSESTETADWDRLELLMKEQFGERKVSRVHVPNAGAVLKEKMPPMLCFKAVEEDRIWRRLREHRQEDIFFRTDHHWTMLGAYHAYEAWAEEQGLVPVPLQNFRKRTLKKDFLGTHYGRLHYARQADRMDFYDSGAVCDVVYDLGESRVRGMYQEQYLSTEDAYRFFLDGNHAVVQITTGMRDGHLAVLKDSFANNFVPFLLSHYGKITVIDPRYFRADAVEWLSGQDVTQILILAQDAAEVSCR